MRKTKKKPTLILTSAVFLDAYAYYLEKKMSLRVHSEVKLQAKIPC